MPSDIHPSAIVHPKATIGSNVTIGPYSIIDAHVQLGNDCHLGPHVHLTGHTHIGTGNVFHTGVVIGESPQDLSYQGAPTQTQIGDRNTFREHVTVHRSNSVEEATIVGSDNFFMATSHVGHNARVGNHNILANGALIAGHAIVEDRVTFGGNAAIHQFVRVGRLAFMQGNSGLSQDLPPFVMNSRINELSGLNVIGMKRAGIPSADRLEMRKLYHLFFREGHSISQATELATGKFNSACCLEFLDFVKKSQRGICTKLRKR